MTNLYYKSLWLIVSNNSIQCRKGKINTSQDYVTTAGFSHLSPTRHHSSKTVVLADRFQERPKPYAKIFSDMKIH